jgi:uncharacterized protein (UPF0212 family)
MQDSEYFTHTCPHCGTERNAAHVAAELPDRVLAMETARRNARRPRQVRRKVTVRRRGRPALVRCPGCSQEMSSAVLRDHRISCVLAELQKVLALSIDLTPKDPDPYPAFAIAHINETTVEFRKKSNDDHITVDLRKIADITINQQDRLAYIRLLGRVVWREDIKRWRFEPTAPIGRPPQLDGALA